MSCCLVFLPHTADDNMMVVATPADGTFLLYRGVCACLSVCTLMSVCLRVHARAMLVLFDAVCAGFVLPVCRWPFFSPH